MLQHKDQAEICQEKYKTESGDRKEDRAKSECYKCLLSGASLSYLLSGASPCAILGHCRSPSRTPSIWFGGTIAGSARRLFTINEFKLVRISNVNVNDLRRLTYWTLEDSIYDCSPSLRQDREREGRDSNYERCKCNWIYGNFDWHFTKHNRRLPPICRLSGSCHRTANGRETRGKLEVVSTSTNPGNPGNPGNPVEVESCPT